jgi:signal transduction histidine kinase/ActR/RegA family two-component response regulator
MEWSMSWRWGGRSEVIVALLFGGVPLIFVVGIAVFQLTKNVPEARQARANIIQSFKTIRAASAVDEAAQDAERGQRGFLITGLELYLDPYTQAQKILPQMMLDLQEATQGSIDEQRRLLKLQADVTTKMNELASTIAAMRGSGYEAAKAIVDTDVGRISMEAITADLTAITESASARLNAQLDSAADAEKRVTSTFVIGSAASVLALLIGAFLIARAYRRAAMSEQVLQATLDSVREGVAAVDYRGRLRAWNTPFRTMLGAAEGDIQAGSSLQFDRMGTTELGGRMHELKARSRATNRPVLAEHEGKPGPAVEIFHNPTADGGYVVTLLDVTERRKVEEALRQSQKLESVGRMTGGVAHDFNNLLTVIIGGLGLLRRAVGRDPQASQRLDMMNVAAERASRLIKQLLAFARRQPLQPETINLSHVINEALPLVRRAVGESVIVECVVGGGLWNTTIDASEFQAAVLNLAINGRDAMPDGGKLTIEVNNAALDDTYAAQHAEVEPGQYVMFAITDTGTGMDAATVAQVLDPFFTTKPPGEGTGLGLPQVYGFVKQSGGHLKIYSEVGEGTTVKLYLPRSLAQETIQPRPMPAIAVTGTERVLLVDDDEIVRTTVALMMEDLGYSIVEAGSGAEALAILERGEKVDLLFTDVVMPGAINGRQLADRARDLDSNLRVVFTSGYTENAIVHNGQLDAGTELLSKPYNRDQLAAKLRRVLDGRSTESQHTTSKPWRKH